MTSLMVADVLRCRLASDDKLGRLAAVGAPGAAEAICERHREPLARYCRALVGNPEDAADATQAALERAVAVLAAGQAPRTLRPWLYRIAHNAAMDLVGRRRPHAALDDLPEDALADLRASEADRDLLAEVLGDLRGLPERQRGALLLRELAGLSYDELGNVLGTTPQAARQSVFEARTGLQESRTGRATPCEAVRTTLDAGDRRRLRSRSVRAHLEDCGGCQDFARGMRARRRALALLPAPWAASVAAGAAGLGAGGAVLGSWTAAKGLAAVAAAITATAGSLAGVERLVEPEPATPPRAAVERPADPAPARKPHRAPAAVAASAAASPTPGPVARRRAAARARIQTAAASPAAERRERRRAIREAARQPAHPAPSVPVSAPAPVTPAPSSGDASRQALSDLQARTQQAVRDRLEAARQTAQQRWPDRQAATQQALEIARTTTQQALDAARQTAQQLLSGTATATSGSTTSGSLLDLARSSTQQAVDSARTLLEQALSGAGTTSGR